MPGQSTTSMIDNTFSVSMNPNRGQSNHVTMHYPIIKTKPIKSMFWMIDQLFAILLVAYPCQQMWLLTDSSLYKRQPTGMSKVKQNLIDTSLW